MNLSKQRGCQKQGCLLAKGIKSKQFRFCRQTSRPRATPTLLNLQLLLDTCLWVLHNFSSGMIPQEQNQIYIYYFPWKIVFFMYNKTEPLLRPACTSGKNSDTKIQEVLFFFLMKLKFLSQREITFLLYDRLLFQTNPWRALGNTDILCPEAEHTSLWLTWASVDFTLQRPCPHESPWDSRQNFRKQSTLVHYITFYFHRKYKDIFKSWLLVRYIHIQGAT